MYILKLSIRILPAASIRNLPAPMQVSQVCMNIWDLMFSVLLIKKNVCKSESLMTVWALETWSKYTRLLKCLIRIMTWYCHHLVSNLNCHLLLWRKYIQAKDHREQPWPCEILWRQSLEMLLNIVKYTDILYKTDYHVWVCLCLCLCVCVHMLQCFLDGYKISSHRQFSNSRFLRHKCLWVVRYSISFLMWLP